MNESFVQITLGVIGGSGPQAGIDIAENILLTHKKHMGDVYRGDKDAVSMILMQDPGIGGPHGTWDLEDTSSQAYKLVWKNLTNAIRKLDVIDVGYYCIACNTLHRLEASIREWMVQENIKSNFVSIVEATQSVIFNHYNMNTQKTISHNGIIKQTNYRSDTKVTNNPENKVAVLGTLLTADIGGLSPFSELFKGIGGTLEHVVLDKGSRHQLQELIIKTKRNGVTSAYQEELYGILKSKFTNGTRKLVDYVILACTELPLLLLADDKQSLENVGIVLIDPNLVLAEEMLRVGGYLV